jgi:hypothetical protein
LEALDGNAIAGPLCEYFGVEMTTARGTCTHCGTANQIGELRVYNRAAGTVVRCPKCGDVVIVLVNIHQSLGADLSGFVLELPPGALAPQVASPSD